MTDPESQIAQGEPKQRAQAPSTSWPTVAIYALAVLIALAGAVAALIVMVIAVIWFVGLPKELAATLITGLAGVIAVVVGRLFERSNERQSRLREKKIPVYEAFMSIILGMLLADDPEKDDEDAQAARIKEAVRKLSKLTPELITWADDVVVLAWSHYRQSSLKTNDPAAAMFEFERMFAAIRKDLGHSNKNLKPGDLLAFWVNDIADTLAARPDLAKGKLG